MSFIFHMHASKVLEVVLVFMKPLGSEFAQYFFKQISSHKQNKLGANVKE